MSPGRNALPADTCSSTNGSSLHFPAGIPREHYRQSCRVAEITAEFISSLGLTRYPCMSTVDRPGILTSLGPFVDFGRHAIGISIATSIQLYPLLVWDCEATSVCNPNRLRQHYGTSRDPHTIGLRSHLYDRKESCSTGRVLGGYVRQQQHRQLIEPTPAWIAAMGVFTWMIYKSYLFLLTVMKQLDSVVK